MKILLICSFNDNFVEQLFTYVKKYHKDIQYSILTSPDAVGAYKEHIVFDDDECIFSPENANIFSYGKAIRELPHFDIIHALWIEPVWGIWAGELSKKCDKMYVSVGGSDLYRDSQNIVWRILQKRFLDKCDCFSSENEPTRENFIKTYGNKYKDKPHYIVRFGIDFLDEINNALGKVNEYKIQLGIPDDKKVIMLGHNARRQHNHGEMIKAISLLDRKILDDVFFIIPMTYGEPYDGYIDEIESNIKNITSNYIVLREFMNNVQMAQITLATDIMVHVQATDQLSSTMLAHMYVGNPVIAGAWLPYDDLEKAGIVFWRISEISDMTNKISHILSQWENVCDNCRKNKEVINKMSSWSEISSEWYRIYKSLIV